MSLQRPLSAAIFDMDGVLAATEDLHRQSWQAFLRARGQEVSDRDYYTTMAGRGSRPVLVERLGMTIEEADEAYREIQATFWRINGERLAPLPGVERFLTRLAARPKAVATGERREYALPRLDAMGIRHHFAEIVTYDDVRRGKPDPEIFLLAARRLGAEPGACLAFEDSINGIKAARAAGMLTIGVATTHPAADLTEAHLVIRDFCDPQLAQFAI